MAELTMEGNVLINDALLFYFAGYMASDLWSRTTQIARKETHYHHYMGYTV